MCLYTLQKRLKLSKNKIVCYKVFEISCSKKIRTPYLDAKVSRKQIEGKRAFRAKGRIVSYTSPFHDDLYTYGKGLIHSYVTMGSDVLHRYQTTPYVICKCHVPKHTRYVIGNRGNEIAARKIIIDEVIWDGSRNEYPIYIRERDLKEDLIKKFY